jgi:aromatic ring-opening dioxygenase catalytic subunit (LigB family)
MAKPDAPLDSISRRDALAIAAATVATVGAVGGCDTHASGVGASTSPSDDKGASAHAARMPVVYLPHGGGPWPFVDVGFGEKSELDGLRAYLESVASVPTSPPRALLVISAHWEAPVPTVMTSAAPPMLYDYYGFPPASYTLQWPAPGEPKLAARVRALLEAAGIESAEDPRRGFDHGTFVPLKLAYPDAKLPTVQLSLKAGLDPAAHIAIGKALAPLRDEGVFIVGSGMSYHNMRGFMRAEARPHATAFDGYLHALAPLAEDERNARLIDWAYAPHARAVHPREEHLLPLMVVAGAAGADRGRIGWSGNFTGLALSALHFG